MRIIVISDIAMKAVHINTARVYKVEGERMMRVVDVNLQASYETGRTYFPRFQGRSVGKGKAGAKH